MAGAGLGRIGPEGQDCEGRGWGGQTGGRGAPKVGGKYTGTIGGYSG